MLIHCVKIHLKYIRVAITSPSCLEAHAGFFRLSMKGKFVAFWEKFDFHIIYKHALVLQSYGTYPWGNGIGTNIIMKLQKDLHHIVHRFAANSKSG